MAPVIFGRAQDFAGRSRVNVISVVILVASLAIGALGSAAVNNPLPLIVMAIVGIILMQAPRVAEQWERAVVLRLGRFVGLRGPGLFWIIPFVDRVSTWIDQRTITTTFAAEQTLTSDTVPVNVDAVLDGTRRPESRARSAGLLAGDQLGGPDSVTGHHRPHRPHRSAARPRAH
jgi:hypothetical protein